MLSSSRPAAQPSSRPLLVAAIGLVALTQLSEHSVLPDLKQRELLIRYDGAPGTSEGEMSRVVNAATQELQTIPGVETVGAHVGRAITSDEVVDVHSGEIWVTLDSGANYGSTASAIQEVVDGYPGLSSSVGSYANERVDATSRAREETLPLECTVRT